MSRKKTFIISVGAILVICGVCLAQSRMDSLKQEAILWVQANEKMLDDASLAIWRFAELALAEYESSKCLADMLEREGFTVQRGFADMPTAFVASYGSGKPVVGILAEYDALPGVGDVSWLVPNASLTTACWPGGVPGHSWGVVTCSGSSIGLKGMKVTAKTIAAAAIEVLMDRRIVEKAQAEFKEKTKDFTYKSAVPKDRKPRLPIDKNG